MPIVGRFEILGDIATDRPHVIPHGRAFHVVAWAVDEGAQRPASDLYVIVDGNVRFKAKRLDRPDVAAHFQNDALLESGFEASFSTRHFALGNHEIQVVALDAGGASHEMAKGTFVIEPAAMEPPRPRVLIIAAPKSGSSFLHSVVSVYYGVPNPVIPALPWGTAHDLSDYLMERIDQRPFVLQLHMLAEPSNLRTIRDYSIAPLVTWRNLGDIVASADDHSMREAGRGPAGVMDHSVYRTLPPQRRYQFLITSMVPWCLGFYADWKRRPEVPWIRFEELPENAVAYVAKALRLLGDQNPDESRIALSIEKAMGTRVTRMNVGRNGRSAELFSDETKALLETVIRSHFDPVDELIAELPWNR